MIRKSMEEPLFPYRAKRSVGLLAHMTSIPSGVGIGTLGGPSRRFIGFLKACGFSSWQMCPVGPTGYGDSPYQSFSAFAGNPYLIDLEELVEFGLLSEESLVRLSDLPKEYTDYGNLYQLHKVIDEEISERFTEEHWLYEEYRGFVEREKQWLEAYGGFRAFKEYFDDKPWWEWDAEYQNYEGAIGSNLYGELRGLAKKHKVIQFFFFRQWGGVHDEAKTQGVELIGDIPIFVAMDSADVWSHPELYDLDENKRPRHLAGVPPDYFSPLGQFWGNPLYRWDEMRDKCYDWWVRRMAHNFGLFDVVRLDHFRGFDSYWEIPAGAEDARTGEWRKGPGIDFFRRIKEELPNARFIAEDLGIITDEVRQLVDETGLPRMGVLQFGFNDDPKNTFLPTHLESNMVLYSGTHDNDTTRGWYESLDEKVKDQVRRYFRVSGEDIAWDMIRAVYMSRCNLGIVTLQDLLNKNSSARMNTPGTSQGNWQWRCTGWELEGLELEGAPRLRELKWLYDR